MEFYREVAVTTIDVLLLKKKMTIKHLPKYCSSITEVCSESGGTGEIYCIWGGFTVQRVELKYGVCFLLLNCPHALTWSITQKEDTGALIVHCTIAENESEQEFVESIYEFVTAWCDGLTDTLLTA
ncbi:MAG: hypothetical protein HOM11_04150 [Methylococcales bacterium]|jgi:hypothetical protein|nr:hypothetical protein [Methylococcales bacterium]MBT7445256.1 hypothetical protein [Methylococcales bacterium]